MTTYSVSSRYVRISDTSN